MSQEKRCPQCGAQVPIDAPQGLCPQCLMKMGLPTGANGEKAEPAEAQSAGEPTMVQAGGFLPPKPSELAGEFPQLDIIELLGQGGMGAVYKARQPGLDRLVALKILPPQVGRDIAFAERFTREARAMAMLNHPHIVSVYDFGKTHGGLFYFVMEFVDGTDLRHVIQAAQMSPAQALAIIPQICEALQYAHEEGIVHRDIKPENVLLDKKGRVKITDFGLAKLLDRPATAQTLTHPTQKMGTPHYMAPEQVEHPHEVDHRADIYSLGVVFYEMLTGELPLGRFAPPSKKVQVDVRLDEVVLKTLEKEPQRRYQQASEVKTDVETICHDERAEPGEGRPESDGHTQEGKDIEDIRQRVWIPAAGMLVAGSINGIAVAALAVRTLVKVIRKGFGWDVIPDSVGFLVVAALAAYAVVVISGAWHMMQLRSHRRAVVGAALAVLPFSPGAVVGIPMGIWALVLLTKEQVKAAFGQKLVDVSIPPKVREFAISAVEEVKAVFDREKAEFQKLGREPRSDSHKGAAVPPGAEKSAAEAPGVASCAAEAPKKGIGIAIASFVLGLVSMLIVSVSPGFAFKFAYGFVSAFLAGFMAVMVLRRIKSKRQWAEAGFAVAGLVFASISALTVIGNAAW